MHLPAKGRSVILTCDIDMETAQTFGGPVWHLSVWPPSRPRAEAVLSGVGEGMLFDEPGVHSQILHLRRRMTTEEMKQLGERNKPGAGLIISRCMSLNRSGR